MTRGATLDLDALEARYTPGVPPACHICGSALAVSSGDSHFIVWACPGGDWSTGKWVPFFPDRTLGDDHYTRSLTSVRCGDPGVVAVIALVRELRADLVSSRACHTRAMENVLGLEQRLTAQGDALREAQEQAADAASLRVLFQERGVKMVEMEAEAKVQRTRIEALVEAAARVALFAESVDHPGFPEFDEALDDLRAARAAFSGNA